MYLVGPDSEGYYEIYYWTDSGWTSMGNTSSMMSGYVTEENLYAGADGTGTPVDPAEGTILALANENLNFLAKDNTEEYTPTGDYNPATKKYVDDREIYATEDDIDELFADDYEELLATKEDIDKLFE